MQAGCLFLHMKNNHLATQFLLDPPLRERVVIAVLESLRVDLDEVTAALHQSLSIPDPRVFTLALFSVH